jgi:hypothetical protein
MAILMLLSIFLQQSIQTGLAASITVPAALNIHPESDQSKAGASDNPGADLRMAAVVTSIKACTDTRSLTARIKLYLRITYTNPGTYPLLLHRENSKVIGGYRIASSPENLAAKKYETAGSPYYLSFGPPPELIAFANLKPGRAFSVGTSTEP